MSLSWRARRRWALAVLLVGLPVYIALALVVVSWFDRPPLLVELAIYIALGVAWALPLRVVFLSVGRPEPEEEQGRASDRAE
jgi:Protein of unknown function (DUF2842)